VVGLFIIPVCYVFVQRLSEHGKKPKPKPAPEGAAPREAIPATAATEAGI
jgi:hypothetical protein